MNSSVYVKKPPKHVPKISRFIGDAKWPLFRVKRDETIK